MLLTIAHTFAYALIQMFGFSIFTLALQRLLNYIRPLKRQAQAFSHFGRV